MRLHYASSKPFVKLRKWLKIDKPTALPMGQWDVWDADLKAKRPIAYFFIETLPDWLEVPVTFLIDPIDDAICYLRRRFIYRTHLLDTGLKKGQYYEYSTRLLHGVFNELVKYVEIEKSWSNVRWGEPEDRKKYNVPWYTNYWYLRWTPWKSQQSGLDHLVWEMELSEDGGHDDQANTAEEIYILYLWWKEIRANRNINEDAFDESGMAEFYKKMDEKYGSHKWGLFTQTKLTATETVEYNRLREINDELEARWEKEDDEMLERLLKVRRSLWS